MTKEEREEAKAKKLQEALEKGKLERVDKKEESEFGSLQHEKKRKKRMGDRDKTGSMWYEGENDALNLDVSLLQKFSRI